MNIYYITADDWSKNGVGRWYSGRYGYGLMDAEALIQKGIGWKNVPEQRLYSKKVIRFMRAQENVRMTRKMENNSAMALAHFTITADDMKTNEGGFINLMEHVTVKITTKSNAAIKRGQFRIKLISPMGTTSKVLDTRKYDYSTKRLDEDHFMTVQLWDEKAIGDWTLVVENTNQKNGKYPKIFELDLHIRGTGNDQYDTRRSY